MLKSKFSKTAGRTTAARQGSGNGGGGYEAVGWEFRPGGMLVQKRNSDRNSVPVSKIKVRVKHGPSCHEISISPQTSFGELKTTLAGQTGLHPQDQKLVYKDKERSSKSFLDVAGVKDGSKMVLIEDSISRERRVFESRKIEMSLDSKASIAIAEIRPQIDKLAKQVATLEIEIYGGKKAEEAVLSSLIELLMTQLLKLDEIVAEGDVKSQRREQVRRVQKYIETLDRLKVKNAANKVKAPLKYKQMHSSEKMPFTAIHFLLRGS
ncbi:BAG family molecular chaperone regulator like [Actinidia chinensis var. chinensis]|uniref:BAG family molecular chaperone regulator like n=1 Tax=Actinidia chinensis var. chinensis TaxID=1590841 RepID=A0A2R6QK79_ACTCC|nr:BAG family molecular chaperone regulator like [Actinidia chinensis var. chinensis]